METVTIEKVQENERGWTEVTTAEYDEPLVTKESKLAKAAKGLAGQKAKVDVNVKENGNFTNRYLNGIEPAEGSTVDETAAAAPTPTRKDDREETQKRIAAQWAIGRAVELHAASGGTLETILDGDTFAAVQTVAESLLKASQALADKG